MSFNISCIKYDLPFQIPVSSPDIISGHWYTHYFHKHFWLDSSDSTVSTEYRTIHIIIIIIGSVSIDFQSGSVIIMISEISSVDYHLGSWIIIIDPLEIVFIISTLSFHSEGVHLFINNYSVLLSDSSLFSIILLSL